MNLTHLVHSYGYWAVLLLVLAESLGVPLPGETALILAGAYAGQSHHLNPYGLFAVAAAGAVGGNLIGYSLGRIGGFRLARRWGSKIRLDERRMKIGRYVFDRQGGKVVLLGRFVFVLRTYAAFLAGTLQMRFWPFLAANIAGGLLWAAVYTTISYLAGSTIERLSLPVNIGLGVAAAAVVIVVLVLVRRQAEKLGDKAEEAYPEPLWS
jgi:membrane protein DedA with SNARE-associated domain